MIIRRMSLVAVVLATMTSTVLAQDSFGDAMRQQQPPQQGYPPQQGMPGQQGYPSQQGYPAPGMPQQGYPPPQAYGQQGGYPSQQGIPPQQQYPGQQGGYPPQQGSPPQQGVPPQQGYPQQGHPPQAGAIPPQQGYPQGGSGMGGGADLDKLMQMERQDYGVAPPTTLHTGPMHGQTPNSIPGGQVITTKGLVSLMQGGQTPYFVFDVLGGPATLPNAMPSAWTSQPGTFDDQIQQQLGSILQQGTQGRKDIPMIFYCQSTMCWMSYNAALRTIKLGYTNVLWYRGGIEAWQAAGLPTQPAPQAFQGAQPGGYGQQPQGGYGAPGPQGGGYGGAMPQGGYAGQVPQGSYGGQAPQGGYGGQIPQGGYGGQMPQGGYQQRPDSQH